MRIRKRLALSDLHRLRSEAAPPASSPPPPDQNQRWALLKNEDEMKRKQLGDDHEISNNDIRKIVNICDGGGDQDFNANPLPSSSSSLRESCCGEDYKLVPLKKRKGIFERNSNEEASRMKSKTNKKCGGAAAFDRKPVIGDDGMSAKKIKRGDVIMEGSRCSRVNGRGWRCCQPTLVGYSLCEHHLGKGRLSSIAAVRRRLKEEEDDGSQSLFVATKKRRKVGVVKARSMSSLLSQI